MGCCWAAIGRSCSLNSVRWEEVKRLSGCVSLLFHPETFLIAPELFAVFQRVLTCARSWAPTCPAGWRNCPPWPKETSPFDRTSPQPTMCGIAGIYSLRPAGSVSPDGRADCRGPASAAGLPGRRDDFRAAGRRVFGHDRLAIIDLSPAGNQPMWDADGRVCLTFNGEIYNYLELRAELQALGHRLRSASDSEVILESFKRWGTDAFSRWNGMFALALFDQRDERMFLVRDRFGVKPLYYVPDGDRFISPRRATRSPGCSAWPDRWPRFVGVRYYIYDHAEVAPYVGMKALMPGHWLEVGPNDSGDLTASLKSYYDFSARHRCDGRLAGQCAYRSGGRLGRPGVGRSRYGSACGPTFPWPYRSVADWIRPPWLRWPPTIRKTISAASHSAILGRRGSEGPLAAELGRWANIDVTYIWPNSDEICRAYLETIEAQAGPFPDASVIAQYLVYQAARAAGFKVLLGGQGGDEVFMGYRKFQVFQFRRLISQRRYLEALGFGLSLLPTFFAEYQTRWASWTARHRYLGQSGMATVLRLPDSEMNIGYRPTEPLREPPDARYHSGQPAHSASLRGQQLDGQ